MCSIKAVIAYGLRRAFELKDVRKQEERERERPLSDSDKSFTFEIYPCVFDLLRSGERDHCRCRSFDLIFAGS